MSSSSSSSQQHLQHSKLLQYCPQQIHEQVLCLTKFNRKPWPQKKKKPQGQRTKLIDALVFILPFYSLSVKKYFRARLSLLLSSFPTIHQQILVLKSRSQHFLSQPGQDWQKVRAGARINGRPELKKGRSQSQNKINI